MAMFNYESEELYQMARGETTLSSPVYMADCKKEILTEVTPNYPKLSDYEKEWMYFAKNIYEGGTPVPLEYLEVQTYDHATVENVIPYAYKSAIFKGNTKYRDIDTGDILDTFDETKNLELVSVKTPTLTTIGKNLNSSPFIFGAITGTGTFGESTTRNVSSDFIKVLPNTTYKLYSYDEIEIKSYYQYNDKKFFMNQVIMRGTTITFTTDDDANYIKILIGKKDNSTIENVVERVMLTTDNADTSYEAYKTNVLSCSEEIRLRGIGNIKDELNLLTGELTQRVGEFTFDGDETWGLTTNDSGLKRFICTSPLLNHSTYNEIANYLSTGKSYWNINETGCYIGTNHRLVVTFNSSDERYNYTLEEFKTYLQTNPFTIQYHLANETIKTVDLSGIIKPYEGTNHYTVTSDTITPQLILSVPIESTGNKTLNDINTEE